MKLNQVVVIFDSTNSSEPSSKTHRDSRTRNFAICRIWKFATKFQNLNLSLDYILLGFEIPQPSFKISHSVQISYFRVLYIIPLPSSRSWTSSNLFYLAFLCDTDSKHGFTLIQHSVHCRCYCACQRLSLLHRHHCRQRTTPLYPHEGIMIGNKDLVGGSKGDEESKRTISIYDIKGRVLRHRDRNKRRRLLWSGLGRGRAHHRREEVEKRRSR